MLPENVQVWGPESSQLLGRRLRRQKPLPLVPEEEQRPGVEQGRGAGKGSMGFPGTTGYTWGGHWSAQLWAIAFSLDEEVGRGVEGAGLSLFIPFKLVFELESALPSARCCEE